jgi:hypothetical protein
MSAEDSIRILLGRAATGREPLDAAEWKRAKARVAWVRGAIAALEQAQRQMDVLAQSVRGTDEQGTRCSAAVDRVSEAEFNRIFDEKQAIVHLWLDLLNAVVDDRRGPPHLQFGGI